MCTIGAVNLDGFVLFKTRDPVPGADPIAQVIRQDNKLLIQNDEGCYGGINAGGLAIVCSHVGKVMREFVGQLIPQLLDSASAEGAVESLRSLKVAAGGNLLIADPLRAFVVEYHPKKIYPKAVENRTVRTNHFLELDYGVKDQKKYPSTFYRFRRANALVRRIQSIDDIKALLRDHKNGPSPRSICRHRQSPTTSAFIIDTKNRTIHFCQGSPCKGEFVPYTFEG